MGWKEFFKPTTSKVILTLVLFLLVVLITFSSKGCATCISPGQCGVSYCIPGPNFIFILAMLFFLVYGLPALIFSSVMSNFANRPFHPANIPGSFIALLIFLFTLLWVYLLTCVVYSIYQKLKK